MCHLIAESPVGRVLQAGLLSLALTACGGGGGGGGGGSSPSASISIDRKSIDFIADEGSFQTLAEAILVTIFGDEIEATLTPGADDVSWVDIDGIFINDSDFRGSVLAYPQGVPRGLHQTSLRLTARTSSGRAAFADLPISLEVLKAFSTETDGDLIFREIDGDPSGPSPSRKLLELRGEKLDWEIGSTAPWLDFSSSSGLGESDVTISVARGNLAVGRYDAPIVVSEAYRGTTRDLSATYDIRAAQLTVTPSDLDFAVGLDTPATDLQQSVVVVSEVPDLDPAKAVTWQLRLEDAFTGDPLPWLEASSDTELSVPATSIDLVLDMEWLRRAPSQSRSGYLFFDYTDTAGVERSTIAELDLDFFLPMVRGVAPVVVAEGQSVQFYADIPGIGGGSADLVRVGSQVPTALQPFNSFSLRHLSAGPFAEGQYRVDVPNQSAIDRSFASLTVRTPPPFVEFAIESPGAKDKLLIDPRRDILYLLEETPGVVRRVQFSGGTWIPLSSIPLNGIKDILMTADGDRLHALAGDTLYEADLADSSPSFSALQEFFVGECSEPQSLAGTISARTLVIGDGRACAGELGDLRAWDQIQGVPSVASLPGGPGRSTLAEPEVVGIGSIIARNGSTHSDIQNDTIYGTLPPYFVTQSFLPAREILALSYAAQTGTILVNDGEVYRLGNLLGTVPRGDAATLGPVGNRVYVYDAAGPSGPSLSVYDSSTSAAGGPLPLLTTIPVSVDVGLPVTLDKDVRRRSTSIRIHPFGHALFVSGEERVAVIPLPAI